MYSPHSQDKTPCVIAIDIGGQSSRVALFDVKGQMLSLTQIPSVTHRFIDQQGLERVEQNPLQILDDIKVGLAAMTKAAQAFHGQVVSVGFAGPGSSCLVWDKQTGVPLTPLMSWQDIRGGQLLADLSLSETTVIAKTGLRLSAHYGASKFLWAALSEPKVKQAIKEQQVVFAPLASFIFNQLDPRSELLIDAGHAQRTLLWNIHEGNWDSELLAAFNLTEKQLPNAVGHQANFAHFIIDQQSLGLSVSMRDQGASLFASGMPDEDKIYINLGTGGFIQRVTGNKNPPAGILLSPLWFTQSQKIYGWEATVNGAAAAIQPLTSQFGLAINEALMKEALTIELADNDILLNAFGGLSAPFWRTDVQSQFLGCETSLKKIAAWLESILFQIQINLTLMQQAGKVKTLVVSGGLSNNVLLMQHLADLTGMNVCVREVKDATLYGIAYMASGQPKEWHVSTEKDQLFLPKIHSALSRRFDFWQLSVKAWLA